MVSMQPHDTHFFFAVGLSADYATANPACCFSVASDLDTSVVLCVCAKSMHGKRAQALAGEGNTVACINHRL
jgi:hypothetical protein